MQGIPPQPKKLIFSIFEFVVFIIIFIFPLIFGYVF